MSVYKESQSDNARSSYVKSNDDEINQIKAKIEEVCSEIELKSKQLNECADQDPAVALINEIFEHFNFLKTLTEGKDIKLENFLKELLNQDFTDILIKSFGTVGTATKIDTLLYCVSNTLFYQKEATNYVATPDFFGALLMIFEESYTFPNFNDQARIMFPLTDIIGRCCNSKENAEIILASGIFDRLAEFLAEQLKDYDSSDPDPDVLSYEDGVIDELFKLVNRLLYYYQLFSPDTVKNLLNLSSVAISNKHHHSFKIACKIVKSLYFEEPGLFACFVGGESNVFTSMLDLIDVELEDDPTGLDISPIIDTLTFAIDNKYTKLELVDSPAQEEGEDSIREKPEEGEEEGDPKLWEWKKYVNYSLYLSKKLDPDALLYYVYNLRSDIESGNCPEANSALLLLAAKMNLDKEVSTDIEIPTIFAILSVVLENGSIKTKEAFQEFFFTYLKYAPIFLMKEVLSSEAVIDYLNELSGTDIKGLGSVIDFIYRVVEVLGRSFMEDDDNYLELFDNVIPEFVDNIDDVPEEYSSEVDVIMSHYKEED